MNNIIKDYFGLEIPIWMQSRKNLFLLFCFDFFLFIYIKTDQLKQDLNGKSFFLTIFLAVLWCLISYVNGKYSYFKKNAYLADKVIGLIKSNLISLTLIYIIDKVIIIYYPEISPFGKNKIFLLGTFSFFLQFLKLYVYKLFNTKTKLYLLGNDNDIDSFKSFVKQFPISRNIEINLFRKDAPFNSEKISLLIFNEDYDSEDFFRNSPNLNIEKLTLFKWCEKYLNRIPSDFIKSKDFNEQNWIVDSDSFQWRLKRFGDVFISILIILFSSPLILFFSFLIWIEDKGPVFYSQTRTGLHGKTFKLTKLRSMRQESEIFGPVWASKDDKRITKIGGFLRRTRIDELPQLFSVLIGDMSLIGPRPERPEIEITLKENIPYYDLRRFTKPGLSGWAQVNYPYGASIEDSKIKLSYELFYIRNHSLWLDILIFIKTIKLIINMKGSNHKI